MNGAYVQHSQLAACRQMRPSSFSDNSILFDAASDEFYVFIYSSFKFSVQCPANVKRICSSELNWSDSTKRCAATNRRRHNNLTTDLAMCTMHGGKKGEKKKIDAAFEEKPQRPLKLAQLNEQLTLRQTCVDLLRAPAQDAESFWHRRLRCVPRRV